MLWGRESPRGHHRARNQVLEAKYTYDDGGLIIKEVAKENLFTSEKDYGHTGGASDRCMHKTDNPWMNQNPEWETTVRDFTYDDNGQMTGCKESRGQFDKVTYTYAYDEAGNRTLEKKAKLYSYLESWQNTYTYNDDNQMVAATVCEGNLTKKYTFTYDSNGNLTAECFRNRAEVTCQYDTENRLTAVYDQQKLLMASTYDGDGNRAFQLNYNPEAECGYGIGWGDDIYMPEHSQNEDGSLTAEGLLFSYLCSNTGRAYDLTEYVNDTNRQYTEVLTAYTVNSGATESYSYAGRMRNSRNDIWTEARGVVRNETSYYLYDGRGSVTANTWYNGMVTDVYQYAPYGQVTLGNTEHTDFYGYNAESYNPNTGLEYLRARYYNVKQGRFFQEDTYLGEITDPLTLNRYAYVKNSPMNYVDPSGEDAIIINRTIASGGFSESVGIEHMGALIQDGDGKWYYLFFGEAGIDYLAVNFDYNDPFKENMEGFWDLDDINQHFTEENKLGTRHPFDTSVYIKGDFSTTHEAILELIDTLYRKYSCTEHETSAAEIRKECALCRAAIGSGFYDVLGNNCSQVVLEYVFKGILPGQDTFGNPLTVGNYFQSVKGFSVSPIPNINMNNLQRVFGNEATNSKDFEESIIGKTVSYLYENGGT